MRVGPWNNWAMIRGLEFLASPLLCGEGRRARNEGNDQLGWHDKTSIKIQKVFSRLVTHPYTRRVIYYNSTGTGAPELGTILNIALCIASCCCSSVSFIICFNKLVSISVSPNSVSCSSKLLETEEWLRRTSVI